MKVRELIATLELLDPEAKVWIDMPVPDREDFTTYGECTGVTEETREGVGVHLVTGDP